MAELSAIEYTVLNKRECFAYKVPPATSAAGYKAADWASCVWKGRLQVCVKGDVLVIKLIHADSGEIFVACPVPADQALDRVIERTVDSSRYFVLTMTNPKSGVQAKLGIGFDDRGDAFDFNVALSDFKAHKSSVPSVHAHPIPHAGAVSGHAARQFSLKQGEKITVHLKGSATASGQSPKAAKAALNPFILLPPPGSSRVQAAKPSEEQRTSPKAAKRVDIVESLIDL